MRIALICNEYPPLPHGGIGTFVETFSHELHRKGHQVTVVGLGKSAERRWDEGVEVITLRRSVIPFFGNLISRIRLHWWLRRRTKTKTLDVIEVPDFQGTLPFTVRGCVVVVRLHLTTTAIWQQAGRKVPRGLSLYERWTLKHNSNWVAVSHYVLELTKKTFHLAPGRFAVVSNPPPSVFLKAPDDLTLPFDYVLYAGQLSERKGALVLAEAAREFLQRRPNLHLVYIGGTISADGPIPLPERILATVGSYLAGRVHFLGHVDRRHVLECMRRAQAFVFPSRLEAFGLVVLEAMSCGVPVICTRYEPGPEIVEDGVTGLLVDPVSPKDICEKIERVLDDPCAADQLAQNAKRVLSERFSITRCVEESERFYRECANV